MFRNPTKEDWTEKAAKLLAGRTIVDVRYMTPIEVDSWGWSESGLILTLDNNVEVMVVTDDAMNGAGSLLLIDPSRGGALPVETMLPSLREA